MDNQDALRLILDHIRKWDDAWEAFYDGIGEMPEHIDEFMDRLSAKFEVFEK